MAEILGLASSIITVVGVAGKLGTSTIRLKRLWDEVQDVPASIRRCIEHLELLVPAIEEIDDEFQRTRTMVQNDSAARRSLEYSRKAVVTLESLVRDMETQLTTAKKGRRLVTQLKIRMKKEVIEEHQQELQSVLQLVTLSQQTYLIALSRAQPEIIISEIRNWQNSNYHQLVSGNADEDDVATNNEQTTDNVTQAPYNYTSSRNWWGSRYSIPWRNAGLFGRISYFSQESVDNISTSQLRVQPPNWLASKAWDLQVYRALAGWNIQLRTWITRPWGTDIFVWILAGSTDLVLAAIMKKEASLYDKDPDGDSLGKLALLFNNLGLLGRLIDLGISLDDIDVADALPILLQAGPLITMKPIEELNQIWSDEKENLLKTLIDEKSGQGKAIGIPRVFQSLEYPLAADLPWYINWETVDPQVVLDAISQGLFNVNQVRRHALKHYGLKYFTIRYLHEYLNRSPWMKEWRLITQKLFQDATWEELVALEIDQTVKDIWTWQFPLGAFGKWLNSVLKMFTEDLNQAGIYFKEITMSHDIISCKQSQSGLGTMWLSTGDRSALWDPYVEELVGEFWLTIETRPLAVPGSWVSDDDNDSYTSECLFHPIYEDYLCCIRRRDFYGGNECIDYKHLRVRGMMTCREMRPHPFDNGTII